MLSADIDTDVFAVLDLEFSEPPQCEGALHWLGIEGHVVGAPAAYLVDTLCPCKDPILKCAGWCIYTRAHYTAMKCSTCLKSTPMEEVSFIPLDLGA